MVEWKKLGEVASYYRGVTYNKKQEVPFNSGGTKILRANNITLETNSLNFEDVKEISSNVIIKDFQWLYPNDILICAGSGSKEHVGKVAYISSPLKYAYGGFMGKIIASEGLKPRFLFHIFSSSIFKKYLDVALNSTTINNLNSTLVNDFQIPIPSLSEQERIVSILDTFTASIDNIKAQIEQRRKQYEHYRNTLLTFSKDDDSVEWKTLEDIFELRNGYTPSKANSEFWTDGTIPWFRMEDIRDKGRILSDSYLHITESAIKGKGLFKANSFILATTATIGEHALLIADSLANQRFTNLKIRKSLINNIDIKFMFYYMFVVDEFCKSHTNVSGFASVDMNALKRMAIPIPSLARQQEIVSTLDTFEASITNLEAQLEQRQKQYEYYREELLTNLS